MPLSSPDLQSLGFRTDLALLVLTGSQVEDRGTHLVVRSPDNPTYWWGNFLLLREPPVPGGEREVVGAHWTELPDADHVAIGLDGTGERPEVAARFAALGLAVEPTVVMTATAVTQPLRALVEVEERPLSTEEDWEQRVALGLALFDDAESAAEFVRSRARQERALVAAGHGQRYGGFVEGRLVSTAAIFRTGAGVARFQSVETHPDHRRQGLAAAVVHAASRHAFDEMGVDTLVMVAEEDGPAIRIYRRLGFVDTERMFTAEHPPGPWPELT